MDALSPRSNVHTVVVQKGAQVGASEFMLNVLGYRMDLAPSPILAVQPTIEMARRFSRQRLAEMLELSPTLKSLTAVPADMRRVARRAVAGPFQGIKIKGRPGDPVVKAVAAIAEVDRHLKITVDFNGHHNTVTEFLPIGQGLDPIGNMLVIEDPNPQG